MNNVWRREDGALSLEAAIVLPFFLAFVIALQALIQLAVAQMALRSAVSETVKVTATHMYPVQLLYREAKGRLGQTRTVAVLGDVLDKIESVRGRVESLEDGAERASALIPEPVLELVRWEKEKREQLEQTGLDELQGIKRATFDAALNAAFTQIAYRLSDRKTLSKDRFRVTRVTLPDFEDREEGYFALEAEYDVDLRIPFLNKTVRLREQAMELAWLD